MNFGIIGNSKEVMLTLTNLKALSINKYLYLADEPGEHVNGLFRKYIEKLNNTINFEKEELTAFLKQSDYLVLDIKGKQEILHMIREWMKHHQKGAIILRYVNEYGLSDRIAKWLVRKEKKIEVVTYPNFSNSYGANEYSILGGRPEEPFTKKFRRKIAELKIPIFLTDNKEAEIMQIAYNSLLMLQSSYIIELSHLLKRLGIDIEIIKKSLIHQLNLKLNNEEFDTWQKGLSTIDQAHINQHRSIFILAEQIISDENYWAIEQVRWLLSTNSINNVAVWGSQVDTIKQLLALPVNNIRIYSEKGSIRILSPKIKYIKDLYQSAEDVDMLLILSYSDLFASVSLTKLRALMAKKIIVDQMNLFELEEMRALNWTYISKGRPNLYKR